jgi:hypothetical protein
MQKREDQKNVQAIAHTLVVRSMRKSAVVPALAALVVIEPARNSVPLVIPIARIRHRFELHFGVAQQRSLVVRDSNIVLVIALAYEVMRLTKRVFRLGRAGILLQDRLEICPRARQFWCPKHILRQQCWRGNVPTAALANSKFPLRARPRR